MTGAREATPGGRKVSPSSQPVPPLRTAERLMPANPEVHNSLATALQRSGHKDEAQKEFAIHERLQSAAGTDKPE